MDDKELQKKKQAEIEIIQKIGLAALEKSNQQRIEVEKKSSRKLPKNGSDFKRTATSR